MRFMGTGIYSTRNHKNNSDYKLCISNFPYMIFPVIEMILAQVIRNTKKIMCFIGLL